jgi:hypothetical protein
MSEISTECLMQHVKEISKYVRISGSEEETRSLEYVKKTLAGYGLKVKEYQFDAYIGYPESAELLVSSPQNRKISGVSAALAPSTSSQGIEAEIAYVGSGDEEMFSKTEVRGKLVLVEGLAEPAIAKRADNYAAVGEIFINDEYAHEGTVSVVWGTPTRQTVHLLPATPCISITQSDGTYLKQLLEKGRVTARLVTATWRGWRKIPVVTADLPGRIEKPRFVMLSGHIDSWYYGAMDNATGNATMLEVARILCKHRDVLRRGLRVAFWSGHSHGRYSGSAWYADSFWLDLEKNCVANVNADLLGSKGATILSEAYVMPETRDVASSAVEMVTGQKLTGRGFSRAGDQSFWGIGIPSIFMALSEIPIPTERQGADPGPVTLFGPSSTGWGWWWHTPHDTVDKIDPENLRRDATVYALVTFTLCTASVLPFDYRRKAEEIKRLLEELQESNTGTVDMRPLIEQADKLILALNKLNSRIRKSRGRNQTEIISATLMRLGRILIPMTHTRDDRFEHDSAVDLPSIPCLEAVHHLARLDKESDEFKFLHNELRRNTNRVANALDKSLEAVDWAINALG